MITASSLSRLVSICLFPVFYFCLVFIACDRDVPPEPLFGHQTARESAEWVREAVVYEVYLRSFSPEGTFEGLRTGLSELKDLGVTVIWLMPIHPVGEEHRKGSLGSPYSVRDYFGINPEFGTLDDFKRLIADAHSHGMKVIIDLVANHTSWDNNLIHQHPEWYTRNEQGDMVPPNEDWWDVADLNYDHPVLREYMLEVMRYWVEDIGIDGYRCDVSELVPTDFWEEAREILDRIKPVLMVSEGNRPEHHLLAFDVTYAWDIYHTLPGIMQEGEPATRIDTILENEKRMFPRGSLRLRFSSNHDENAWDAPAVEKWGEEGAQTAAVLVTTLPGIPLVYNGDEVGNDTRLDLFEKVGIDWSKGETFRRFYSDLLKLYGESSALKTGSMLKISTTDDAQIYAFARKSGDESMLVLINLKQEFFDGSSDLTGLLHAAEKRSGRLLKKFGYGPKKISLTGNTTIEISLPGFRYAIYELH